MNLHVLTPLARLENYGKLAGMLKADGVASWNLLLDHRQKVDLPDFGGWARFHTYGIPLNGHPGAILINRALRDFDFIPEDWYCWLCDDDWLQPQFTYSLQEPEGQLIVCSMHRGDQVPAVPSQPGHPGHPTWPLIANPMSLHYGGISFQQGIMRGDMIRDYRSRTEIHALDPNEKALIEMARKYPTQYRPEVFIWLNYLEPGRWNHVERKPRHDL